MDFWGSGSSDAFDSYDYGDGYDEENEFLQDSSSDGNEWRIFDKKDSLIYLVDCSSSMHMKDEDGYTWHTKTIQTIVESVRTKIIVQPNDHVGVVFYNTREARNNNNFPGIYVLLPCAELRADSIRQITQLRSPVEFENLIGSARTRTQESDLYKALWVCSDIFQTKKNFIRRIFLFTTNDDPTRGRSDLTSLTVQKFTDLNDLGIEVHLFPLDPGFLTDDASERHKSEYIKGKQDSSEPHGSTDDTFDSDKLQSIPLSTLSTVKTEADSSHTKSVASSVKTELEPSVKVDYSSGIVGGFNLAKFFARVLLEEGDYVSDFVYRIKDQMSNLLSSVKSKMFKKRSLGTLEFRLGRNQEAGLIGLNLYCNVKEFKIESGVRVYAQSNEPLRSETQWICPVTGARLEDDTNSAWLSSAITPSATQSDSKLTKAEGNSKTLASADIDKGVAPTSSTMSRFFPYAGQRIPVTTDEMKQLKTFGEPSLMLLGFKNESSVKIQYNLKASYFLFPNDERYPGSNVSFVSLVQSMARNHKVAIARLIARRNALPRLVALLPQLERIDEVSGVQVDAFGLHMVFLPFADEVRRLTLPSAPAAPIELIDKAKLMISKLTLPYKDRSWIGQTRNPVVQRHYDVLQAVALNTAMPTQVEDQLQPIPQLFEAKESISSIKEFFEGVESHAGLDVSTAPRQRATSTSASDTSASTDLSDFSKWPVDTEALKKLTIPQLKEYLKHFKLPVAGNKDALISRIFNHMTSSKS